MLLDALFEVDLDNPTRRNDEPAYDSSNFGFLGQDLIYLSSYSGNGSYCAAIDIRQTGTLERYFD